MQPEEIIDYLKGLDGVVVVEADGSFFVSYAPSGELPATGWSPFAILVTTDDYDQASDLRSRGLFRMNLGVGKETYHSLFGEAPAFPKDGGIIDTGHDFTARDVLLPHPIYAAMHWVSIVSPSREMFDGVVRPLIAEAYEMVVAKG
jgi:hypothetical protein